MIQREKRFRNQHPARLRCPKPSLRGGLAGLLFFLSALFVFPSPDKPKFVVGIMIDGLQQEHIRSFYDYFEQDGLKKIIDGGSSLQQVKYDIVSAGNASDIATVMTGTTPAYHGVAGSSYYNRRTKEKESILYDMNQVGIGTSERYSARKLLSSTFVDELMLSTSGQSKAYVVSIDPEAAIMMGGHTAKSAAWIDDVFLKWVAAGYYSDGLIPYADQMNIDGSFTDIAAAKWQPLFPANAYVWNAGRNAKAFEYIPASRKSRESSQTILRNTPAANTLVTELAIKLIKEEKPGSGIYPDILMLQYTVRTPDEQFTTVRSLEKEDMYMRLDKEIKRLLETVEWETGIENTLFFIFSNKTSIHTPLELGENKIPAGYFNADRSIALLNTYLMALYGQERWVEGYSGKNIFLNRQLIEQKRLDLNKIQHTAADFMMEFEGIRTAYTVQQIQNQAASIDPDAVNIRNSYHKDSGGDIVISLLPGWLEVDSRNVPIGETNSTSISVPVYFYGWKIPKQEIDKAYSITDIAPTLSYILRIPQPNACIGRYIEELRPLPSP